MAGTILPRPLAMLTGKILSVAAGALHRVKTDLGLSAQDLAELAGKSDRKSGQAYLAGESDMGLAGFVRLCAAVGDARGEAAKAAFASDVLRPLTGLMAVPCADGEIDADRLQLVLARLNLKHVEAWADRKLTHGEILGLADVISDALPLLCAVMAEADRIRGH
jgi:hypothetical protein